ncbi:MAG: hypothetical protein CVU84_13130 [Firmicutes bacterium HGW-Firmicutes-1]|jgi:two-component system sensor histidine kinase YesM|nr:MAG: hypothetical protein CVU84_13130 [Firmicutes bacterium HGW-Firmicutes-1]
MRIKHLRIKFVLFISLLTVGVISILGTITVSFFSNAMLKEVKTIAAQKMQIITSDLEEELKYIFNLSENIKNNQELEKNLYINTTNSEELYEKMRLISNITREYAYADVAINSIFVIDKDNQIFDPFYMMSPYKEIVENYEEFHNFNRLKTYSAFSLPTNFPSKLDSEEGSKSTITYFETYISKEDYQPIGTILINVKIESLFQKFKNACKAEFDTAYIVDKQGNIVYKIEEEESKAIAYKEINDKDSSSGIFNVNKKDYYFIKKDLEVYPGWKVIGIMEYNNLKTNINTIMKYFYGIAFLSIIIILISSFVFSKKITKPILNLKESMDILASGEWPEPLVPTTHDEIRALIEGYNNMLDEHQKLIEQIYHEQEEKKKKEVETVQLKLDLLHSQINPHFIHNTLHTMQYLLKANKTEGLLEMLISFNRLLRFNMSIEKDFITIEEEKLCIDSFIKILEYRYDYSFKVEYTIPEDILDYLIPKLILQPLVENAIYHGIIPKGVEGKVLITMKAQDENLFIEIEDNGVGIEKDLIDSILNNKQASNDSSFNQIGVHNIDKRLKLLFGAESRLTITSTLNIGTTVAFSIPLRKLNRKA